MAGTRGIWQGIHRAAQELDDSVAAEAVGCVGHRVIQCQSAVLENLGLQGAGAKAAGSTQNEVAAINANLAVWHGIGISKRQAAAASFEDEGIADRGVGVVEGATKADVARPTHVNNDVAIGSAAGVVEGNVPVQGQRSTAVRTKTKVTTDVIRRWSSHDRDVVGDDVGTRDSLDGSTAVDPRERLAHGAAGRDSGVNGDRVGHRDAPLEL